MEQMKRWHTRTEQWLMDERFDRESADEELSHLFTALTAIEPSEDFVQRTVQAAIRTRARHRLVTASLAVAAGISLAAVAAGAWAYGLSALGNPESLVSTLAALTATSTVSLLMAGATSVEWWAWMTGAGSAVAAAVTTPQNVGALLLLEAAGGVALYALHKLLRADVGFRDPGPLCL